MIIYGIFVFVFGLLIGSFLNVCIYRIPAGESIVTPGSHCFSCKRELKPLDLIPVISWIVLGGKCRYCRAKISPRYAVVELLTAVLFVLVWYVYSSSPIAMGLFFVLVAVLIAVTFTDIDHMIIPNGIVIFGLIFGVASMISTIFGVDIYTYNFWWEGLLGALAGALPLVLIGMLGKLIYKKDAMGGGDVKLMFMVGLFLGWQLTFFALFVGSIFGGIIAAVMLAVKRKKIGKANARAMEFPFGPFLVVGSIVALLVGYDVINWYIALLM